MGRLPKPFARKDGMPVDPADVPRAHLVRILQNLQAVLYLDCDAHGDFWNPDKALDSDHLDMFVRNLAILRPPRRRRTK